MLLSPTDQQDLNRAVVILENPGLAAKLTHMVGMPLEKALAMLPENLTDTVQNAARRAMEKALDTAVLTLDAEAQRNPANGLHKTLAGVSGAVGGFFGAPALALELPVTTTVMLRSIADIARSEGEWINTVPGKLACMEVFALGGPDRQNDQMETGYYAVRAALASSIADATQHISKWGMMDPAAPVLVRLIGKLSSRFGVTVSQKLLAQAVPAIGAVGGASINLLFIQHFQTMAEGHFIVRRLERRYGEDVIKAEYRRAAGH